MTQIFAVNDKGDVYVGPDGRMAIATGIIALAQRVKGRVQTLLGELPLAADEGIPYFEVAFTGDYNMLQFESYVRQIIIDTPEVTGINSLVITVVNKILSYTAEIDTVYGPGVTING